MICDFTSFLTVCSHIRTIGGKAVCNEAPFTVEKISPRTEIELGSLDQ